MYKQIWKVKHLHQQSCFAIVFLKFSMIYVSAYFSFYILKRKGVQLYAVSPVIDFFFISLYTGVDIHILLSDKMQGWSSLSPCKPEDVSLAFSHEWQSGRHSNLQLKHATLKALEPLLHDFRVLYYKTSLKLTWGLFFCIMLFPLRWLLCLHLKILFKKKRHLSRRCCLHILFLVHDNQI